MEKETLIFNVKSVKDKKITVVASDETVDRDGEVIKVNGWNVSSFNKNPVMLLFHDYHQLPVGKWNVSTSKGKLIAEAEFATTEKAKEVEELVRGGFLSAVSVGFIVKQRDEQDPQVISKAELLEISWVPVPANPSALVQLMAKGYTFSCEKGEELEKKEELLKHYKGIVKEYRKLLKTLNKEFNIEYDEKTPEAVQIDNLLKAVIAVKQETPLDAPEVQETPEEYKEMIKEVIKEEYRKVLGDIF